MCMKFHIIAGKTGVKLFFLFLVGNFGERFEYSRCILIILIGNMKEKGRVMFIESQLDNCRTITQQPKSLEVN